MPETVLAAEKISESIGLMADKIFDDQEFHELLLLGMSEKGLYIAKRLAKKLEDKGHEECDVGRVATTLYRPKYKDPHRHIQIERSYIPCSLRNKVVVLVDVLLNSGESTVAAMNALSDYERPFAVKVAVLFKTPKQQYPVIANYVANEIKLERQESLDCHLLELDGEDKIMRGDD